MTEHDFAYLAGLIDGEGSIYYKRTKQKRNTRPGKPIHNVWVIRIEIAMTSEDTLKWCHETFKCGSFGERKVKPGKATQQEQFLARLCEIHANAIVFSFLV